MPGIVVNGVEAAGPGAMPTELETNAMYAELERTWQWPKALSKYLREEIEILSPEDFVAALKTDKDWDRFNDQEIKDPDKASKVIGRGIKGRVLRAHGALKAAQDAAAKQKAVGEDNSDLDVLLDPGSPRKQDCIPKT